LKYKGDTIAEVWFKPEGELLALTLRIAQTSFQIPEVGQRLTAENLLKSVGIATEEVESWRHEGASRYGTSGSLAELGHPLPEPKEADHLTLHVSLKPPRAVADEEIRLTEVSDAMWQELETRWNVILGLEASVETLRVSMEAIRAEMEGLSRRTLTADEKANAPNADVAQWSKAKSRIQFTVPKVKEFIHRATWAAGTPERKSLEELFKNHVYPRVPFPDVDQVMEQLGNLQKDRQILSTHGASIYQECKGVAVEVQGVLRTLLSNAAANATKKRAATSTRGKIH
jgi:hypothetical protein